MPEFNTEDAARCPEQAQQVDHAIAGSAIQFKLFGKERRFKRLYFDETMMLKLNSFAREVTKLTTDFCAQYEFQNEEAKARAILSSLHEELSIFIDKDRVVFARLSRDLVYNIAADAKDIALKFEIPSTTQDLRRNVVLQSWRGSPSLDEGEDHVACPRVSLC